MVPFATAETNAAFETVGACTLGDGGGVDGGVGCNLPLGEAFFGGAAWSRDGILAASLALGGVGLSGMRKAGFLGGACVRLPSAISPPSTSAGGGAAATVPAFAHDPVVNSKGLVSSCLHVTRRLV